MTDHIEICREPLEAMELGGSCQTCGHPAPSHSHDGPCVMCWIKVKVAHLAHQIDHALDRLEDDRGEERGRADR